MNRTLASLIIIISIFFIENQKAGSQTLEKINHEIDSLALSLRTADSDSLKIRLSIQLFNRLARTDQDSAMSFLNIISEMESEKILKIDSGFYLSAVGFLNTLGDFNLTAPFTEKASAIYEKANDSDRKMLCQGMLGYTYYLMGELEKSADVLIEAMNACEKSGINANLPYIYVCLGFVYRDLQQYATSEDYFNKCLEASEASKDVRYVSTALSELGNICQLTGKDSMAIDFLKRGLKARLETGDTISTAYSYNDIAVALFKQGDRRNGYEYLEKSYEIMHRYDMKDGEFSVLLNLAILYSEDRNAEKALDYIEKAEEMMDVLNSKKHYQQYTNAMTQYYIVIGDYENALLYNQHYHLYSDSIRSENITNELNEIHTKYQTEKKDQELKIHKLSIAKQKEEINRQRTFIYSIVIGGVFLLAFSVWLLFLYRFKARANRTLSFQKAQILEKNEELQSQAEEIRVINEQLNSAFENLTDKNNEILDSIQYAKQIQKAIMPDALALRQKFAKSFLFFKPRDIIGGDFFWTATAGDFRFAAIADCTGHGVPGALMSMLGISLLNEIVQVECILDTDAILIKLRNKIIATLKQKSDFGGAKDGMDISICRFDDQKKIVSFSGANNSMILIREEGFDEININNLHIDGNLAEFKPDKMPVSIFLNMSDFSSVELRLKHNDMLYLFTDGYADQIGGPKNKKYMSRPFKKLLSKIASEPVQVQLEIIAKEHEEWKGNQDQVDDISVLGIRYEKD